MKKYQRLDRKCAYNEYTYLAISAQYLDWSDEGCGILPSRRLRKPNCVLFRWTLAYYILSFSDKCNFDAEKDGGEEDEVIWPHRPEKNSMQTRLIGSRPTGKMEGKR